MLHPTMLGDAGPTCWLRQMTSRFVGCLTIICDNAFLPTPANYECQAPKIWVPRDQLVSGSSP